MNTNEELRMKLSVALSVAIAVAYQRRQPAFVDVTPVDEPPATGGSVDMVAFNAALSQTIKAHPRPPLVAREQLALALSDKERWEYMYKHPDRWPGLKAETPHALSTIEWWIKLWSEAVNAQGRRR